MREHGTRACYCAGCRREECVEANRAYARERDRATRRPDAVVEPAYVDNTEAAEHLRWLSRNGVGRDAVRRETGISTSVVDRIRRRDIARSRQTTIDRILGVGLHHAADGTHVPASETWRMIDDLLADGWSKAAIARVVISPDAKSLQLSRRFVHARNARAVRTLHAEHFRPLLRRRENDAARRAHYRRLERDRTNETEVVA